MRLLIDYLLHTYVGTYEACKVLRYFYRKRFKFYPNSFFEYASKVIKRHNVNCVMIMLLFFQLLPNTFMHQSL